MDNSTRASVLSSLIALARAMKDVQIYFNNGDLDHTAEVLENAQAAILLMLMQIRRVR